MKFQVWRVFRHHRNVIRCSLIQRAPTPQQIHSLLHNLDRDKPLEQHTPIYPIRTLLPHHPRHWVQQFLGLNFTCLLTNHLRSRLHNLQAIQQQQRYHSHPLGKFFIILLVKHYILVHISHSLHHLRTHYDLWSVGSVMKFQARNLPDRIFCGTYAEVFAARGPVSSGPLVLPLMIEILAPLTASTVSLKHSPEVNSE
jgi:hypothetical protein